MKYESNVLLSSLGSNEVCCCSVISAVACEFLCLSLCTPENVSEFEMHNKSMMHTYVCVCVNACIESFVVAKEAKSK